jgi:hypothetical protein
MWILAHVRLPGNEMVDGTAKDGAKMDSTPPVMQWGMNFTRRLNLAFYPNDKGD